MKQEIMITTKDRKITAKLYENNKLICKAHATCHPEDKFDLCEGSRIVVERLKAKYEEIKSRTKYDRFADGEFQIYCKSHRDAYLFVEELKTKGFIISSDFYKETYLCDSVTFQCHKNKFTGNQILWVKGFNYAAAHIKSFDNFKTTD